MSNKVPCFVAMSKAYNKSTEGSTMLPLIKHIVSSTRAVLTEKAGIILWQQYAALRAKMWRSQENTAFCCHCYFCIIETLPQHSDPSIPTAMIVKCSTAPWLLQRNEFIWVFLEVSCSRQMYSAKLTFKSNFASWGYAQVDLNSWKKEKKGLEYTQRAAVCF